MLKNGDYVYLYNSDKLNFMLPYQDKATFSCHKGNIKFEGDLNYGDKILTTSDVPFYILKPTMADKMMKVKRRTTIIYPKEAGTILLELDIRTGARVIEIGSGSGSLTLLLSQIVGDTGKIYSFERRPEHQEYAIKNLNRFGIPENVEFFLKDPVEEDGFGLIDIDSIFLDVPEPWTVVPIAHRALVGGGHIGSLSPNIEQVQQTVEAMERTGFARIRCVEIWSRGIRVKKNLTRPHDRMIGHTGYLLFAEKIWEAQYPLRTETSIVDNTPIIEDTEPEEFGSEE